MIGGVGSAWLVLGAAVFLAGGQVRWSGRVTELSARERLDRVAGTHAGTRPGLARVAGNPATVTAVALAVVAAVGGWVLGGPVLAAPFVLVIVTGAWLARRAVRSRTRSRATADLVHAVGVITGELSSGAGPAAALGAAAELGGADAQVFADAAAAAEHGGSAAEVLLAGRSAVRVIGHAWRIGEASGAPLAVVLDRVAVDLAAEIVQRRAVMVTLAGPRSSATVLAGLPLLGVGLGVAMDADPLGFLTGVPVGRMVCAAGIVLDLAGVAWMARILQRAEST